MIEKTAFIDNAYKKLKTAIVNIDEFLKQDIYALSFWFYTDDDDQRFPVIWVSYNTNTHFKSQISTASSVKEAKWNFAFWLQKSIEEIGGKHDDSLIKWFNSSSFYYSDEDEKLSKEDKELDFELSEKGSLFCDEFIETIISITQRLFLEKAIVTKFGKNIPILIHELEYADYNIEWNLKSNPEGLTNEFIDWINGL